MIKQMVSFTEPQYYALQKHATELGIPFAELVRRIVDQYRMQFDLRREANMGFDQDPSVEIWVENAQGKMVQSHTYKHDGCLYVEGTEGRRYMIRVDNPTFGRVEMVATVDGLDVLDGKPGNMDKSGLVVAPRITYDFEGFRVSNEQVAAFRFGAVGGGYAASKGDTSNVGVIGVAMYQELEDSFTITHTTTQIEFGRQWQPGQTRSAKGIGTVGPSFRSHWTPKSENSLIVDTSLTSDAIVDTSPIKPINCSVAAEGGTIADVEVVSVGCISPALATEFGEALESKVGTCTFKRRTTIPWKLFTIRYESRENLVKLGIVPSEAELQEREQANPFPASKPFCEPPEGWQEKKPVTR